MLPAYLRGDPALLDDRFPLPLDRPFTTAQARREGVPPGMLTRLVARGLVRRVVKGAYAVSQLLDSRRLRGQALGLVVPPGSVVTDFTASWFWAGVDRPGTQHGVPRLSVYRFRGHDRLRNTLVEGGERWFLPSDVTPLDGKVSITTPKRTAWDLGRFQPRILALGGMDALARSGAFTVEELCADVERFRRQRGVVQLRRLAPLVDPRAESPGESALRLRWREAPYMPPPELQIPVVDDSGRQLYRIDLGVEELGLGVEYDGELHHSSERDRAHDARRRRDLRNRFRWLIEVFRREDVFGQHECATYRLPAAVRAARESLATRVLP
jgi:hypothetical protein